MTFLLKNFLDPWNTEIRDALSPWKFVYDQPLISLACLVRFWIEFLLTQWVYMCLKVEKYL